MINKIHYLVNVMHWDVVIVTTDQKERSSFYELPEKVRTIDLDINYSDDNNKNTIRKIAGYLRRRRLHRERLEGLLTVEKPDILVSLYPSESSFYPDLKDGSKKVLELHFNRYFRLQYGRTGLYGLINRWRTKQDEKLVRKFDRFVVLTEEDREYWGEIPNISVIPNAVSLTKNNIEVQKGKRVIAVGRLDYQKGFDRLIEAWKIVQDDARLHDWHLDIFGQGEWEGMLNGMINEYGLSDTVCIHKPTKKITEEYQKSELLVMSSHYEGLPMVMIEAMAQGVPVVCFDFKCGPKDIIQQGVNGKYVKEGDIQALADAMKEVMHDDAKRQRMSEEARNISEKYSEERIMKMWVKLFEDLVK